MSKSSGRKILVAFLLNLGFSIYEFIGGTLTGSVAITSDAIHDMGDALSIGIAYFLEKKSQKRADRNYTYGYMRYSLMGGMLTTLILIVGSIFVISSSIARFWEPVEINYDGMLILAIIGVTVNFMAAWYTREGKSLNQKSVNLHMLEDVLGWAVVLVGAIVMRITNFSLIDPILSILVAGFILKEAIQNCMRILDILLEKTPRNVNIEKLEQKLRGVAGIKEVHHVHIWSLDEEHNYATMHVVSDISPKKYTELKTEIRALCKKSNIEHITIEIESLDEKCKEHECAVKDAVHVTHAHHEHNHSH